MFFNNININAFIWFDNDAIEKKINTWDILLCIDFFTF